MSSPIAARSMLLAFLLAGLAAPACSTCDKPEDRASSAGAASLEIPPGRLETAWTWSPARARDTALPAGCKLLSRPLRVERDTRDLVFFAAPGHTQFLAVATGSAEADAVSRTRGLLPLNDSGEVRDIPWLHVADPPVMAASSSGWIALLTEQDPFSSRTQVWLWRQHGPLDRLAEGDRLAVVDAHCNETRCAVLTTRAADVATRGATLWFGDPRAPAASFERADIEAEQVPEGAIVVGIVRWSQQPRTAVVAFQDARHVSFVQVDVDAVRQVGKVERGQDLLDVTATRDALVTVVTRGQRDSEGCVPAGGEVEVVVPGEAGVSIPATVPPRSGYARRLGEGAFVTWISPINCKAPDRKIVSGVILGVDGKPVTSAMAIGNADGHAVTTKGNEVHVWLRDPRGVTWLRGKCDVGPR